MTLNEAGIVPLLFKGSLYLFDGTFPELGARVMSDLDLMIRTEQLSAAVDAPLSKATFLLAERFGWTPQEVGELTLGQVLLNLKLLSERSRPAAR